MHTQYTISVLQSDLLIILITVNLLMMVFHAIDRQCPDRYSAVVCAQRAHVREVKATGKYFQHSRASVRIKPLMF